MEFVYPEIQPEVRLRQELNARQIKGKGFYLLRGALDCFRKIPEPDGNVEDLINTLEKYCARPTTYEKRELRAEHLQP